MQCRQVGPGEWVRRLFQPILVGFIVLMTLVFGTVPAVQAGAGFGPGQYKSGYTYGNGIFFAPYALNIHEEPDETSPVVESIRWSRQGSVVSEKEQTPRHSGNVFFCFYPELDVAMMAVVGDTDTGWVEVIYDQGRDKTGWVKATQPIQQAEGSVTTDEPPSGQAEHMGVYQTWLDFMKLNSKAHGIYWLGGVNQYNRSIRMSDDDKAKLLPLTIVRDIKVKHVRGNWLLVEVLDFERNTPIGWVRWRDNDGNLMVFPNFTGDKGPIVTTVY